MSLLILALMFLAVCLVMFVGVCFDRASETKTTMLVGLGCLSLAPLSLIGVATGWLTL